MSGWVAFWDRNPSIYVSDTHLIEHYRVLARDLVPLVGGPGRVVVDFGCGDALASPAIVASGARLLLYDATPAVQERLRRRYAAQPQIVVLDDAAWRALPDASVDTVLVNSVLQYVAKDELPDLLRRWRELLRPGGQLLLCDVVPPDVSAVQDAEALLRLAASGGFMLAALAGLARTAVSDYRRLRRELGFSCYTEAEMLSVLRGNGFVGERLAKNVGPTPHRMSFRARPA